MKMFYKFGIIIIVSVSITVTTSIVILYQSGKLFAQTNEISLISTGEDIKRELYDVTNKAMAYSTFLSQSDNLKEGLKIYNETGSRSELINHAPDIYDLISDFDSIKDIEILDPKGLVLLRSNNRSSDFEKWGDDKGNFDYIRSIIKGDRVGDIFFDLTRNRFDIRSLKPVYENNKMLGIVSSNYAFDNEYSNILKDRYDLDVIFFMVGNEKDNEMIIVGSTIDSEITWDNLEISDYYKNEYKNSLEIGGIKGSLYSIPITNSKGEVGAVLVIMSNNKLLHSMQNKLFIIIGIIISISVISIIIGSFIFIWQPLMRPIVKISKIVPLIAAGDLTQELDVSSRKDEIGIMSGEINTLVVNMHKFVMQMKNDILTLNHSVQDLNSSSKEISTTSNEQASAVKEIVSTMEDSDSLSKSIEKKIVEVAKISDHAREIVSKGVNNVERSLVKMDEIRNSNHETIKGMKLLSEKIDAIWDIVSMINSVADQTKIIAFNAELEASAAGEAGKNFQIVALEIRRLADSTVSSTSEIKSKITEIQHSSDRLITASEDGTNKIAEGGKLTQTLYNNFEEILESTEISANSANTISSSVKQQVLAFEQILQTLRQISEGINSFVISTKSTAEITHNLNEMSDSMKNFLADYKTISDN